jgi:hypothetical protein
MNDPTSVAEQARRRTDAAGKRVGLKTTARRCAYVTALILVLLIMGVGGVPIGETWSQELPTAGWSAEADTLARADQDPVDESGHYEGVLLASARHKTH